MPAALVVPATGEVIAERVEYAATAWQRARGLLRRTPLGAGEALVLERARQVHTFGMAYALDVCFCDRAWRVLHVVRSLRPRRVTRRVGAAFFAVETPAGGLDALRAGDQLSLVERSER